MLNLIVCLGDNGYIGDANPKGNGMSWHIPDELRHFKNVTSGHVLIFGKTTSELVPLHKMKDRIIEIMDWGVTYEEILERHKHEEIFICGGASIYKHFIKNYKIDNLYISYIKPHIKVTYGDNPIYLPELLELKKEYMLVKYAEHNDFITCKYTLFNSL